MNPGGDTHQGDWNEQRESISTYVDGALSPDERAHFEEHLAACAACQRELEAMRQVYALLRRMPQPTLPRSFTLPAAPDATLSHAPERTAAQPARAAVVVPFTQRAGRIAQRVGTLAAAVGVALLLGWAVLSHPGPVTYQTSSGAASNSAASIRTTATARQPGAGLGAPDQTPREGTSSAQSSHPEPATSTAPTSSVSPSPTPVPAHMPPSTGTTVSTTPAEGPPVLPLTGAGLLIGGAAVAVTGRAMARRGRARRR